MQIVSEEKVELIPTMTSLFLFTDWYKGSWISEKCAGNECFLLLAMYTMLVQYQEARTERITFHSSGKARNSGTIERTEIVYNVS